MAELCFVLDFVFQCRNTAEKQQVIQNGYITFLYFSLDTYFICCWIPATPHYSPSTVIVLWALLLCLFPHPCCNVSYPSSPGNSQISIWPHACISRAPWHTGSSEELLTRAHYVQSRQHCAHYAPRSRMNAVWHTAAIVHVARAGQYMDIILWYEAG